MKRLMFVLTTLAAMAGCAAQIPQPIAGDAPGPTVLEASRGGAGYVGSRVRWGGTVASVDNRENETVVEVVARELGEQGRPQPGDRAQGRFLARFDGFLEPTVYQAGREITVLGTLSGFEVGSIGQYTYRYPVAAVEGHVLWEPVRETHEAVPPFWYYDPLYPWYYPMSPYHMGPFYRMP